MHREVTAYYHFWIFAFEVGRHAIPASMDRSMMLLGHGDKTPSCFYPQVRPKLAINLPLAVFWLPSVVYSLCSLEVESLTFWRGAEVSPSGIGN